MGAASLFDFVRLDLLSCNEQDAWGGLTPRLCQQTKEVTSQEEQISKGVSEQLRTATRNNYKDSRGTGYKLAQGSTDLRVPPSWPKVSKVIVQTTQYMSTKQCIPATCGFALSKPDTSIEWTLVITC